MSGSGPRGSQSPGDGWCSSNPHGCPCGQFGAADRVCTCPPGVPERYLRRVSGPLRDRIDLWVRVDQVPPEVLLAGPEPESSAAVAGRIASACERQRARVAGMRSNVRLQGRALRTACAMSQAAEARAILLAEREGLSARGVDRLLRVARTIADLAGDAAVEQRHLDEAARFRSPVDRMTLSQAG